MNETLCKITQNIIKRSEGARKKYLQKIEQAKQEKRNKMQLSCSNLAHAMAPLEGEEKALYADMQSQNFAIITAYNDMLSAHEPYADYPEKIKKYLLPLNATAQVSSGVPAMCDGITQNQVGMQLSLLSRDTIAMSSAVGLSHNVYDGAFYLGVCDKIVPGLLISALSFGHLPSIFVPSGPMPSGVSNAQKARTREAYAEGKVTSDALLDIESKSYHSCGTCTFYGTANSNQMLLEMMGLQLPNSSFVNTNTPLREALIQESVTTLHNLAQSNHHLAIADIISEKSIVNAMVGLLTTGGSSNHTIHLVAIAKAAGISINWSDFDALSKLIPLTCKLYPNGSADVNHFHEAGGMGVVIAQLLELGLVHNDVKTIVGDTLDSYLNQPVLNEGVLDYTTQQLVTRNSDVISMLHKPFQKEGGVRLLHGNLGRAVLKTSALKETAWYIKEKVKVFDSQEALQKAFASGELHCDFIAVIRFQGPKANGMPELHALMAPMGALQELGYKVGILTDGRMSGASGKVLSVIHVSPETLQNSYLQKIENEDLLEIDVLKGSMHLHVNDEILKNRVPSVNSNDESSGSGRELFSIMRENISSAEEGASFFTYD